jgi:flagellar biosynthesis/type III secretory pathway M-ring protein FliF/YscJ
MKFNQQLEQLLKTLSQFTDAEGELLKQNVKHSAEKFDPELIKLLLNDQFTLSLTPFWVYFLALVMTFLFNKRLISSLANTSLKNISLLEQLLKTLSQFTDAEGELLKQNVKHSAEKFDPELIKLLLNDPDSKAHFFDGLKFTSSLTPFWVYFLALVMTFLFNKRLISSLANTSLKNISLRFSSSFDTPLKATLLEK